MAGQATELPSLGSGALQAGTGATSLVTDRATTIPAYFVGHWIEVQDGSGNVKGTYRISAIGTDGKTVTVTPDTGVTYVPTAGDKWQGVYHFDTADGAERETIVLSGDPIRLGANGVQR